jgi:AcrR family transcriptional regulator
VNGYEKRSEAKKQKLISAARELFIDRGFTNVSVQEIAKKAETSPVSIYNYFGDKTKLAEAAFLSYIENALVQVEQLLFDPSMPLEEKITAMMQMMNNRQNAAFLSVLSSTAQCDDQLVNFLRDMALAKRAHLLERFIEQCKEENQIDKNIPTQVLLDFMNFTHQIVLNEDFLQRDKPYREAMIKLIMQGAFGIKLDF